MLRGARATAIGIGVKGHIDSAWSVTQLLELASVEMVSERAGDVMKAGLPQHGIVEETFH